MNLRRIYEHIHIWDWRLGSLTMAFTGKFVYIYIYIYILYLQHYIYYIYVISILYYYIYIILDYIVDLLYL